MWRCRSPRLRRNCLSLWSERVTITICNCFWFALSGQIDIPLKVSKNASGCKLKATMPLLAVPLFEFVFKQYVGGLCLAICVATSFIFFHHQNQDDQRGLDTICTELNTLTMRGDGGLRSFWRVTFVNRNGPNDWFQADLRTNLLFWSKV